VEDNMDMTELMFGDKSDKNCLIISPDETEEEAVEGKLFVISEKTMDSWLELFIDLAEELEEVKNRIKYFIPSLGFQLPSRILRSGRAMIVFWEDGTKTVVKRMEGEKDSNYAAFTAALAKKIYGSNSAVWSIVNDMVEYKQTKETENREQKKTKKKK